MQIMVSSKDVHRAPPTSGGHRNRVQYVAAMVSFQRVLEKGLVRYAASKNVRTCAGNIYVVGDTTGKEMMIDFDGGNNTF